MALLTLPRHPLTSELLLPGLRSELRADFLFDATLPSWLTATAAGGTVISTLATGQGDVGLTTAATTSAVAKLAAPEMDLANIEAVLFEVDGLGTLRTSTTGNCRLFLAIEGATAGARAFWDTNSTTGTLAAKAATGTTVLVPHNAVGNGEAGRRRSLGLLVLPAKKHAYLMMGDQVIMDADLPAMTSGLATPFVQVATTADEAQTMLISRVRLTVWKSTKRMAPVAPGAPSPMTLSATPGDGQNVVSAAGGTGGSPTYALYRGTTVSGSPIAQGAAIFPFTDTGRTNGTAYSYIATATNSFGTTTSNSVSATPTAAPAGPLIADTFTASDGTAVAGRSAAEGSQSATWAVDGTGTVTIVGNAARPASGNGTQFTVLDTGRSAYRVRYTVGALLSDATARRTGLIAAYADTTNYVRVVSHSAGQYVLTKIVGGTATTLVTSSVTAATGDVVDVLRASDGTFTLTVNGSLLGSGQVTDAAIAASTKAGLYGQYNNAAGSQAQDRISSYADFAVLAS